MLAEQPLFIEEMTPSVRKPKKQRPAMPSLSAEKENRREHRHRVLKGATIINAGSTSEIGCTVRNQNIGGAELKVAVEAFVPKRFLLYVPVDGIAYRAEMRWRLSERIGVQFSGKEPKPRTHYG